MRWRRVVRVVAMRLIRILIAASFVASFLVFPVRTASACSCEEAPPDAVALRRSDVVFSGTATGGLFLSGNRHRTSFDVDAVYRGSAHSVQSVQSGSGNGDCGYRFKSGTRYLVFAERLGGNELSTSICANTHPISDAEQPPFAAAGELLPGRSHPPSPNFFWAAITIVVGLVAYSLGREHTG